MTVGMVGFVLGFGLVGEVYPSLGNDLPVNESQFRFIAAVGIGVVSVSVAQMSMRFLAAGLVFLIITNLIEAGSRFNIDFEGDTILSGVLTLAAFFLSLTFRRLVPALMAGFVGTLGMMLAVYISLDWDVARLDGVSAPDAYLALAGMVLSVYVQRRTAKNEREVLGDEELYDF